MDLHGRQALVVGLGSSGVAAARLLLARGARVRAVDADPDAASRPSVAELLALGAVVDCGPHRAGQTDGCDLVVLSPGVPPTVAPVAEARAAGLPVLGEIELGARLARGTLLGVTGSNGKSTTTTLVGRMLAAAGIPGRTGGNLGTPLCDIVLDGDSAEAVHPLELSSFQCETLDEARFAVAAILNVSINHLDRYSTHDDYVLAKLHLLDQQDASGVAVLSADDPRVARAAPRARGSVAWFGLSELPGPGVGVVHDVATSTIPGAAGPLFHRDCLWTAAPHHLANALAASAVALSAGAPREAIARGLAGFPGLPHRSELVETARGPRFINDSKATSVAAAVASIEGSGPGAVVILGGRHKGGDLSGLRDALVAAGDSAVLIGEAAAELRAILQPSVQVTLARDLGEAVEVAASLAGPGGTVLLAPACASFDMFRNYEDRGERFRAEVLARFGAPAGGGSGRLADAPRGGCAA